jgi:hypothetical protein
MQICPTKDAEVDNEGAIAWRPEGWRCEGLYELGALDHDE